MFTGIVAGLGTVEKVKKGKGYFQLQIRHYGLGRGIKTGASVAVNGCCLTVTDNKKGLFSFDLLFETWKRTTFSRIQSGDPVNLETSLKVGDELGGHWVTGHVDEVGKITSLQKSSGDVIMEIKPSRDFMKWIMFKGSVTLDGVSLTVSKVKNGKFEVCLIPHTLKLTTLGKKRESDFVNLEGDILAKYVRNALPRR